MTLAEKLQRLRLPTMSPECNPSPRRWPTSQELAHDLQGIAGHFPRHTSGRVAIEDLTHNHIYRWFADWMNLQLSDIGRR